MNRITVIAAAVCMVLAMSCGQENCLKKKGYQTCDDLKKAFNLQDKDEAIRYHDIATLCGCK